MIVSRYGLHVAPGNIPFLIQPSGETNLISPELRSPFEVHIRPRTLRCPHDIRLEAEEPLTEWMDQPFVRVFLPTPRAPGERAVLLFDPDNQFGPLIEKLSRLCSPTESLARPVWCKAPEQLRQIYTVTNLGPLIWTGCDINHSREANRHITLGETHSRRVMIVARQRVPLFDGIDDVEPFDPGDWPFEAIGAALLRQYMSNIQ